MGKPATRFTFKTEKATGAYSAFFSDDHIIKLNKKPVGNIDDKKPFTIRLMVYKTETITDSNPNSPWTWIRLKKKSETLQEAKDYINKYFDIINSKWKLYQAED